MILLCAVLFSHWLVVFALAVFCIFFFHNFYESILAGFLIDVLYGTAAAKLFFIPAFFTFVFLLAYVLISILKRHLRNYD